MESYYAKVDIIYRLGKLNMADPLSRRPDFEDHVDSKLLAIASTVEVHGLRDAIQSAYPKDPLYASTTPSRPGWVDFAGWYVVLS
jgi:hypothetical protein